MAAPPATRLADFHTVVRALAEPRTDRTMYDLPDAVPADSALPAGTSVLVGGATDTDADVVHAAVTPGDLTGIGVAKCMRAVPDDRDARLSFRSLSTVLSYEDREAVFKFCHVVTTRLAERGYLGVFTANADAHDPETLNMLKQAFDGLVELRLAGGEHELRTVGVPGPAEWTTVEP